MTLEEIKKLHGHDCDLMYKDQIHEPYTPSALGVNGDVIYNTKTDEVVCNECGWQGQSLGGHILKKHKKYKDIADYKHIHGLLQKVPLVSRRLSTIRRNNALGNGLGGLSTINIKKARTALKKSIYKNGNKSMMRRNLDNLCPLQIEARVGVLLAIYNKKSINELESGEISRGDYSLYDHFRHKYGNVKNACRSMDFKLSKGGQGWNRGKRKYTKEELISKLRAFVLKNQRIPISYDLVGNNELPNRTVFISYFGSWKRTRLEAGLYDFLQQVLTQRSQQKVLDRL